MEVVSAMAALETSLAGVSTHNPGRLYGGTIKSKILGQPESYEGQSPRGLIPKPKQWNPACRPKYNR